MHHQGFSMHETQKRVLQLRKRQEQKPVKEAALQRNLLSGLQSGYDQICLMLSRDRSSSEPFLRRQRNAGNDGASQLLLLQKKRHRYRVHALLNRD